MVKQKQTFFTFFNVIFLIGILTMLSILTPLNAWSSVDMTLKITVDTVKREVSGEAITSSSLLNAHQIRVNSLDILKLETINGQAIPFSIKNGVISPKENDYHPTEKVKILFRKKIAISKQGTNKDFITPDYVLLTGIWCPRLENIATYRLIVEIDRDLVAVSEADEIKEIKNENTSNKKRYTFIFDHPRQSITLAAARFFVEEYDTNDDTNIAIYLLKKRPQLAKQISHSLKVNLEKYQKLIAPYPFKRFQVIETPAPLGVTVPTITLIGTQIIEKPFLVKTSIIHELAHSWFGNSVFVDETGGNWCEGLTTYLADYLLAEQDGNGTVYRHDILADYKSYVHNTKNSFPLSRFRYRYDRVSKAIGYGKGAMVFHMLRKLIGDEAFFHAITTLTKKYMFQLASWKDLEQIFSQSIHKDLNYFFNDWLERKDIPKLKITNCTYEKTKDGKYFTTATIHQELKRAYNLRIPIQIITVNGKAIPFIFESSHLKTPIQFKTTAQPRLLIVDPEFDLMRDLTYEEFPPSLARLFGAEKKTIILTMEKEKKTYAPLVSFFKKMGFNTIERKALKHSMLKTGAFLVLGSTQGRLEKLAGKLEQPSNGVAVRVRENPLNPAFVVTAIKASSNSQTRKIMAKLPHYGKYSFLIFEDGRLVKKARAPFENGISSKVTNQLSGIFSKNIESSTWQIVEKLVPSNVIYLGEKHDQEGIHQAQLRIIRELSRHVDLAVGMEMFQAPFQKVIDSYLAGSISEKEFLKQSQYFKRWAFNYHFYRPIVEFCKDHNIPIIALNLPSEISKKIARSGISSLSQKELTQLPQHLDLDNELYKRYLKQIYSSHRSGELDNFDYFFQAQIAWDETMAHNIANYLQKNPDKKMVVIVGGGHVEFGYGIPSRVKRRLPSISQTIALFNEQSLSDPSKADLFLYTPKMEEPFIPKLGVILNGQNKLTVERVIPGSPASKAGFKKGDKIAKVDGIAVKDIYDLKLELFFKKKGEKIKINVKRRDKDGTVKDVELLTGELVPFTWSRTTMDFHSSNSK